MILRFALSLAVALGATSAPALAHPGHLTHAGLPGVTSPFAVPFPAGTSTGGYSSSNVEFVKNFPQHSDAAGGRRLGDYFYITTERDLTIYDISDPLDPVQVGHVVVPTPGVPVFTEEDPDTNGRILLIGNGEEYGDGNLYVFDVSDKTAPKLLSALPDAADHTISCVLDCTWAYGSEGTIVDLRDPAAPRLSENNWQDETGGRTASMHDVTEVAPGRVLTSTRPIRYLDARMDPEHPTLLGQQETGHFIHANLWPRGGEDDFVLVGGESVGPGCDQDPASTFSTWDGAALRETGVMERIDQFRIEPGVPTEGRAPDSSYCTHWFDEHPYYKNGGLVSIAWYEHGTHFLKIGKDGKISEVGWFLGGGGQASAAYWIDERTVYVADYLRGFDILRFTGDIGSPPKGGGKPSKPPKGDKPR